MANATRKEHHSYRLSFAQDVGSSFDPDLEDVAAWEQELTGVCKFHTLLKCQTDRFFICFIIK